MPQNGDPKGQLERTSIEPKEHVSEFLHEVIDALPEALVVIDRNRNIVMANKVARAHGAGLKCYECFHRQQQPCADIECPVERVVETRAPVRVYHTHFGMDGRQASVAIDAAPIFDERGEVVFTIETCRDVTERTLARRLSRIGNRHMTMAPLLAEYAAEIRAFAYCSFVDIHMLDEECQACHGGKGCDGLQAGEAARARTAAGEPATICVRSLARDLSPQLPSATDDGVLCLDRFATYLSSLPESLRNRIGSCVRQECESLALVPIRYANEEIAVLHVADPRPGLITADSVKSLTRLSSELGAAIHRVRVEESLQEARNHLELRVRERTEELMRSNETLQKEIEERSRLERELLDASVREQQRIGQELHDGLGQELTGISYLAQNLVMRLKRQASPEVSSAQELARGIQTVVGEIQKIVRGLVPLEIGAADLKPALEVLAANVEKQTGLTCTFETNGQHVIMADGVAIQMYRIAQEAISNAVKHADADAICVTLSGTDQEVCLEVSDNGVGIPSDAETGPGCGLRSMRHRARAIDGRFDVRRRPGGGTVVGCRVLRLPESGSRDKRYGTQTDYR